MAVSASSMGRLLQGAQFGFDVGVEGSRRLVGVAEQFEQGFGLGFGLVDARAQGFEVGPDCAPSPTSARQTADEVSPGGGGAIAGSDIDELATGFGELDGAWPVT